VPRELSASDLDRLVEAFVGAARRAHVAGFGVLEIHMAHGYLLHEFLSPLANAREDEYGGVFENRIRFPLRVAEDVRRAWPDDLPLFVRISATDWIEGDALRARPRGAWDLDQSIRFARELKRVGVDLVDCSSGGAVPGVAIPTGPGYQAFLAEAIRRDAQIPTAAVGEITDAVQAEALLVEDKADAIFMARELLRDPYWPLHAASRLGAQAPWPSQYLRAKR
jgi:2,4-dienoyl-CoA reductase-like NADH-dependent reductase (Old Yellow Enzyme family)